MYHKPNYEPNHKPNLEQNHEQNHKPWTMNHKPTRSSLQLFFKGPYPWLQARFLDIFSPQHAGLVIYYLTDTDIFEFQPDLCPSMAKRVLNLHVFHRNVEISAQILILTVSRRWRSFLSVGSSPLLWHWPEPPPHHPAPACNRSPNRSLAHIRNTRHILDILW